MDFNSESLSCFYSIALATYWVFLVKIKGIKIEGNLWSIFFHWLYDDVLFIWEFLKFRIREQFQSLGLSEMFPEKEKVNIKLLVHLCRG